MTSSPSKSFPPDVCGIPNFGDLDSRQILALGTKAIVGQIAPELSKWASYQRLLNLVRLTDRTIVDFGLARDALQEYIAHSYELNISGLFTSISHVEAGMSALTRAIQFANALSTPTRNTEEELPSPESQRSIRSLRNRIKHTDEDIIEGPSEKKRIAEGTMATLHILNDGLELRDVHISWSDLDEAVRTMHALTARLIALPGTR